MACRTTLFPQRRLPQLSASVYFLVGEDRERREGEDGGVGIIVAIICGEVGGESGANVGEDGALEVVVVGVVPSFLLSKLCASIS